MKVIIDEREATIYQLCVSLQTQLPSIILEKRVLNLGDFIFSSDDESTTYMLIERKSFSDLLASIKDGRYAEQSHRLTHCYPQTHNTVYLLEGMMTASMSDADKRKIFSCIASLNYFKGFSVMRTVSMAETAQQIMFMADKIGRDLKDGKQAKYPNQSQEKDEGNGEEKGREQSYINVEGNVEGTSVVPYCSVVKSAKKANITRENIGEIILCQIPGISAVTAVSLMRPFASFGDFIDKIRVEPAYLDGLKVDTGSGKPRKLGSNIITAIKQFLV